MHAEGKGQARFLSHGEASVWRRCDFNGVGTDPSDERTPRAENLVMLDEFWLMIASNII